MESSKSMEWKASKSSMLGDVGRVRAFDRERFRPWQISRGNHPAPQFGPTGVCSIAKVRRHNSIFRLARWDTRKACEVSFKLHALQWLFDDVRP